jgi:hypothetical protein
MTYYAGARCLAERNRVCALSTKPATYSQNAKCRWEHTSSRFHHRLSSILRGEMHNKALASRVCTYERSSPAIYGRLATRRACLRRRWRMRLMSIAPISARWSAACTAQRSIWSTSSRRFWTLKRARCFSDRRSCGHARPRPRVAMAVCAPKAREGLLTNREGYIAVDVARVDARRLIGATLCETAAGKMSAGSALVQSDRGDAVSPRAGAWCQPRRAHRAE